MNSPWVNAIAYQLVWFAAVIGAGRSLAWPGLLAAIAFIVATLATSRHRALDLRLIVVAVLCGVLIDGLCLAFGLVRYAAPMPGPWHFLAPAWILALWAAFSTTLTRSMAWLRPRAWAGAVLGAAGGPLAYLGAARGWGAVTFTSPAWQALPALGLGWAMALALLLWVSRWPMRS